MFKKLCLFSQPTRTHNHIAEIRKLRWFEFLAISWYTLCVQDPFYKFADRKLKAHGDSLTYNSAFQEVSNSVKEFMDKSEIRR